MRSRRKGAPAPSAPSRWVWGHFPLRSTKRPTPSMSGRTKACRSIDGSNCDGSDMSGCSKQPVDHPTVQRTCRDRGGRRRITPSTSVVRVAAWRSSNTSSCNGTDANGCTAAPTMVPVGSDARGAALDSATSTLYVADAGSNTVSLLDTARCNAVDDGGMRHDRPSPCRSGTAHGALRSVTRRTRRTS